MEKLNILCLVGTGKRLFLGAVAFYNFINDLEKVTKG